MLGDLAADPVESLADALAASRHRPRSRDRRSRSARWLLSVAFGPRHPYARGRESQPFQRGGTAAIATARTAPDPARRRARAQASIVAPVVTTSSTSRTLRGAGPDGLDDRRRGEPAPTRAARAGGGGRGGEAPARRPPRSSAASAAAISQAGSNPRRRARSGEAGTGTIAASSQPARRPIGDQRRPERGDRRQPRELERGDERPPGALVRERREAAVERVGAKRKPGRALDLGPAGPAQRRAGAEPARAAAGSRGSAERAIDRHAARPGSNEGSPPADGVARGARRRRVSTDPQPNAADARRFGRPTRRRSGRGPSAWRRRGPSRRGRAARRPTRCRPRRRGRRSRTGRPASPRGAGRRAGSACSRSQPGSATANSSPP